ncbi:MAG: hypothetical protein D6775_09150, partial [Caldilineae bacterium]
PVDPTGTWSHQLTAQIDGLYRVRAVYSDQVPGGVVQQASPSWLQMAIQHESRKFKVDSSLPVDPMTMVWTDMRPQSVRSDTPARYGSQASPATTAEMAARRRSLRPDTLHWGQGYVRFPPVQPGRPFSLTIQTTAGRKNVALRLDLQSPFDSRYFDDLGNGTLGWSGCLTCTLSVRAAAAGFPLNLVVAENGEESVLEGEMQIVGQGEVTDAATGQAIDGATVRLLVQLPVSDTLGSAAGYDTWDSGGGQTNPLTTGADGGYLFVPPAGVYRVQVSAPGYQTYTSDDIDVAEGDAVALAVALHPAVPVSPDVVVEIGEGGFDPSVLSVPPGTVVRWVNLDVIEHSVAGSAGTPAASSFDSGLLGPGESFTRTLSETGRYTLSDASDPFNKGVIVVDPDATLPGEVQLFLPVLLR